MKTLAASLVMFSHWNVSAGNFLRGGSSCMRVTHKAGWIVLDHYLFSWESVCKALQTNRTTVRSWDTPKIPPQSSYEITSTLLYPYRGIFRRLQTAWRSKDVSAW